jgi:hypothetical protein
VPSAALVPAGPGEFVQLDFPDVARAGQRRLRCCLRDDQDLLVDLQVGLGSDARALPLRTRGTLLVDGQQRPVRVAGGPAAPTFETGGAGGGAGGGGGKMRGGSVSGVLCRLTVLAGS